MTEKSQSSVREDERIKALHDHHILETPMESAFDNISKLAKLICNVPIALITFVDEKELFFKSVIGTSAQSVPRERSFSNFTIQGEGVMEVPDIALDSRFAEHPSVAGPPYVRFYAGAPLVDEQGFNLGAISVFDTKPGCLSKEQKEGLTMLAKEVITHLTLKSRSTLLSTHSQRAEELLELSTISPEIHCLLDHTGNILFINDAVTDILEYSAKEAMGLNMWRFCHPEDLEGLSAYLKAGLQKGEKRFNADFRITSKSGKVRWLSWSMVVKNNRWFTYGRDITESKRVEAELKKLSFVASKINNAVVINDADNHVTWVNDAFEKITGFTLEDLKGKRLGDLIQGPDTDLALLESARQMTRENKSFTVDLLAYRKDKRPIWISVYNTVVLNDEGKADVEVEIIIDITDKKKAEEESRALSEAKEMFLSVMSHEIRTPLNAVIGMTHLLLENDPLESQLADLNILKFSSENLLNIINDILDFTKIETGNMILESIPFSIPGLISDMVNSLQLSARKNKNTILSAVDHRIPNRLMGDKTRLYQILMNLLGNAIKFTMEGAIRLKVEMLGETRQQVEIYFEVQDEGIGIPQDKLAYIFETFTQAKTDISRKYGGTGLGLAITKKLLKLYHSDIQVKSTEDRGTTFSFIIKFNKVSTRDDPGKAAVDISVFAGKKILVVDDNEVNILIASRILGKWKLDLDFASTGEEAIQKVKSRTYDLVFMDIKMPGISGFEATAVIRGMEGEYYQRLPIIALTASTLQDENAKFKQSGMNGHLLKPFNPTEIKETIYTFLSE